MKVSIVLNFEVAQPEGLAQLLLQIDPPNLPGFIDGASVLVDHQHDALNLWLSDEQGARSPESIVAQLRRYLERFDGDTGVVTHSQRVTLDALRRIVDGGAVAWAPSDSKPAGS